MDGVRVVAAREAATMEQGDPPSQSETLSAALKLIRAHRRLRPGEVARDMNMALRSYEHFEAGSGRINLERIHRFAAATDSDPYAILASLALGSPEFAVRCADNKLMTIFAVAVQEFDEAVGDAVADLDARTIINTFTKVMTELGQQAVRKDSEAEAWLKSRLGRLALPVSEPS